MWLRLPSSWPPQVDAAVALLLLSTLDLAGTTAAKEAVDRKSAPIAATGALLFVVMFWVFASTLRVSNLVAVTFGWCVLVQVGVVVLDRFRYGTQLAPGKYIAVVVLLLAQAYLLIGPSGSSASAAEALPRTPISEGTAHPAHARAQHALKGQVQRERPHSSRRREPRHLLTKNDLQTIGATARTTRPAPAHGRRARRH